MATTIAARVARLERELSQAMLTIIELRKRENESLDVMQDQMNAIARQLGVPDVSGPPRPKLTAVRGGDDA